MTASGQDLARQAWPELDAARFAAFVAERPQASHLADLALTCACCERLPRALAAYELLLGQAAERAARQTGGDRSLADEIAQRLRERTLALGRLADYSGAGPLAGWLRVAATREALMLRRREKFETPLDDSDLERLHAPDGNPELAYLDARHRAAFRQAFAAAFAALEPRERQLLRRHHLDGASIDTLGGELEVHRATAARWLARARDKLFTGTRSRLAAELALAEDELDSIINAVQSRLEISLRSHLSKKNG